MTKASTLSNKSQQVEQQVDQQVDQQVKRNNIYKQTVTKSKKTTNRPRIIKGSLGGETSVLRTFRMSGKELVKERVSKERVRQGKS